jgi:hypothetical protein
LWWRILRVGKVANLERRLVRRVHRRASTFRIVKSRHHAGMVRVKLRALTRWSAPKSTVFGLWLSAAKWTVSRALEFGQSFLSARDSR